MRLGSDNNNELSNLESKILKAMFSGQSGNQKALDEQVSAVSVVTRNYSGVGFVSKFQVGSDVAQLDGSIRRVEARHPMLSDPVEFVLTLKSGCLDTLEAYAFNGMWPSDESGFQFD